MAGSIGKSLIEYNFVNLHKYMMMVTGRPFGTEQEETVDPEATHRTVQADRLSTRMVECLHDVGGRPGVAWACGNEQE